MFGVFFCIASLALSNCSSAEFGPYTALWVPRLHLELAMQKELRGPDPWIPAAHSRPGETSRLEGQAKLSSLCDVSAASAAKHFIRDPLACISHPLILVVYESDSSFSALLHLPCSALQATESLCNRYSHCCSCEASVNPVMPLFSGAQYD